ncbi:MAG: hypothetical protein PHO26_07345 [Dehalococcoidia bacterium]|nr:hypothetical protein [Dehalococcoidia bacterium]MDD5493916.1 hypothetical protein [Dehalococcoidia bacterium]
MAAHLPTIAGAVEPTFRLFCGNYRELTKALTFYESPESTPLWIEAQPNLNSFYIIEEIIRLLHNFSTGAMTLVDHTRNEADKLDSLPQLSSFRNEYNEEIQKRFAQNENHQLIQGLRNYMLHFSYVESYSNWKWTRDDGEKRTIRISIEPLLKWKKWKPLARQRILHSGDHIIIHDVVNDYYNDIKSFNNWLWVWQGRMVNSGILPM